jgi:hypothetical protein
MDWQPTSQEQAEISNRVALLLSALGLAGPSLSDVSFRSHREQRTVDVTLTIGKRNWAARFVHLGYRNNAVDRWELEYLDPQDCLSQQSCRKARPLCTTGDRSTPSRHDDRAASAIATGRFATSEQAPCFAQALRFDPAYRRRLGGPSLPMTSQFSEPQIARCQERPRDFAGPSDFPDPEPSRPGQDAPVRLSRSL